MNLTRRIAGSILAVGLIAATGAAQAQGYPQQQNYPPQQQQQGQYGQGGWDQAPQEYNDDIHRQGFRDGIGAARSDFEQHRQPNSTYQPQYRHPPVPKRARNDYRAAFQRGYDTATRHMMERHDERRDDHRDHDDRRDDHRNDNNGNYPPPPPR